MGPPRASSADDASPVDSAQPDLTCPMVVLRHQIGPESHWDWLFARQLEIGGHLLGDSGEPRDLLAFRMRCLPPFRAGMERLFFAAEAMADHRRRYLAFEGDLGEGRGHVQRVARGRCTIELATESSWRLHFRFDAHDSTFTWNAARSHGEMCQVELVRTPAVDALDLGALLSR